MKHVLCRTVSFTWGLLTALIEALMIGKMFYVSSYQFSTL